VNWEKPFKKGYRIIAISWQSSNGEKERREQKAQS
jgi:hypothetical protein